MCSTRRPSTSTTPRSAFLAPAHASATRLADSTSSGRRTKCRVRDVHLGGMNQGLSVEPHVPALFAFGAEALEVAEVQVHAVENLPVRRPRRYHAALQGVVDAPPVRVVPAPELRHQVGRAQYQYADPSAPSSPNLRVSAGLFGPWTSLLLLVWGLPHGVVAPRQEPKIPRSYTRIFRLDGALGCAANASTR